MSQAIKAPNKFGLAGEGQMQRLYERLNAARKEGRDFTLTSLMKAGQLRLESDSAPIPCETTLDALLHDIGIDMRHDSLASIVQLQEGQRWIIPEVFTEILDLGMRQNNAFYQALIGQRVEGAVPSFRQPQISAHSIAGQGLQEGGIGTSPVEGEMVTFTDREIRTTKFERKIEIPEEVFRYSTLDQLQIFLRKLAISWGLQLTRKAIDVLINGDKIDGSLNSSVIGVENTSDKLAWIDLTRVSTRMSRLGYMPTTVISDESGLVHVLNLEEFKDVKSGNVIGTLKLQGILPNQWSYFTHSVVPAGKYIFLDPRFALTEFISQGLRVESEKILSRDLSATYVRMTHAFANMFRDARVVVDETTAFSGNGWESFMSPID